MTSLLVVACGSRGAPHPTPPSRLPPPRGGEYVCGEPAREAVWLAEVVPGSWLVVEIGKRDP